MIPVSVAIITKNEEHNIEDALRSVADAGEIVVVDDFSQDKTIEICRKYTDKIYQRKWDGYARQKQWAVEHTKGPWVLILDADERVTPELKKEIEDTILNTDVNGYFIPRKNYFLGKWIRHGGWWPDHTLRLFRKEKGRIENREVHEKVTVEGKTASFHNPLTHYTYRSISDFVRRMEIYSSLAAAEMKKRSGSTGILSLIVHPVSTFFKMYILRRGFLDGRHGFLLAALYSSYTFLKYAKTWERQR